MYYQQYGLGYQYGYGKYGLGYSSDLPGGTAIPPPSIGGLQAPTTDLGLTGSMFSKGSKYNGGQGSPSPLTSSLGLPHGGSSMLSPATSTPPSPGPHALQNSLRGPGATPSPPVESLESKKDLDRMRRCQVCGQVFRLMSECLAHMKSVHSPLSVYSLQHTAGCHVTQPMSSSSSGVNPHSLPVSLGGPPNNRPGGMSAPDSPLMALERMGWGDKQGLITSLHSPSPLTPTHSLASGMNAGPQTHPLVQHQLPSHSSSLHNTNQSMNESHFSDQLQAHSPMTSLPSPINKRGEVIGQVTPHVSVADESINPNSISGREITSPTDSKSQLTSGAKPKKPNSYSVSSIIGETNEARQVNSEVSKTNQSPKNVTKESTETSNQNEPQSNVNNAPTPDNKTEIKETNEPGQVESQQDLPTESEEPKQSNEEVKPTPTESSGEQNVASPKPSSNNQVNESKDSNSVNKEQNTQNKDIPSSNEGSSVTGSDASTTINQTSTENQQEKELDDQPDLLCHEEGPIEDESNESMDESKTESKPSPKSGLDYLRDKFSTQTTPAGGKSSDLQPTEDQQQRPQQSTVTQGLAHPTLQGQNNVQPQPFNSQAQQQPPQAQIPHQQPSQTQSHPPVPQNQAHPPVPQNQAQPHPPPSNQPLPPPSNQSLPPPSNQPAQNPAIPPPSVAHPTGGQSHPPTQGPSHQQPKHGSQPMSQNPNLPPHQQSQHGNDYPSNSSQPPYGNWPVGMGPGYPGSPYQYPYSHSSGGSQAGPAQLHQSPNKGHSYSSMHPRFATPYPAQPPTSGSGFPPSHDGSSRGGPGHPPYPQGHWFPPGSRGDGKGNWSSWAGQGSQSPYQQAYYNYQSGSPSQSLMKPNSLPPPPQAHSQPHHHMHQHMHRDMQQQSTPPIQTSGHSMPSQPSQHRQSPINMQKTPKSSQSMLQQQQQMMQQQPGQPPSSNVTGMGPPQADPMAQKMSLPPSSSHMMSQHSQPPSHHQGQNIQPPPMNGPPTMAHQPPQSQTTSGGPIQPPSGPSNVPPLQGAPSSTNTPPHPSIPPHPQPPHTASLPPPGNMPHHQQSNPVPIPPQSTNIPPHQPLPHTIPPHPSSQPPNIPPHQSPHLMSQPSNIPSQPGNAPFPQPSAAHPPTSSSSHQPQIPLIGSTSHNQNLAQAASAHNPHQQSLPPPLIQQQQQSPLNLQQSSNLQHPSGPAPTFHQLTDVKHPMQTENSGDNLTHLSSKSHTNNKQESSVVNHDKKTESLTNENISEPITKKPMRIGPRSKTIAAKQCNQIDDLENYKCTITVHENGSINGYGPTGGANNRSDVQSESSDNEGFDEEPLLTLLQPMKRRHKNQAKEGVFIGPKRVKIARQARERQVQRQKSLQEQLRINELEEQLASQRADICSADGPFGNILLKSSILLGDDKVEVSETVEECLASIKGEQTSLQQNSEQIGDINGSGRLLSPGYQSNNKKPSRKSHNAKVFHNEHSVNIKDAKPAKPLRKLRAKDFKWSHYMKSMRFWCNDCAQGFKNQRETSQHTEERCKWNCLYMLECYVSVHDVQNHAIYGPKVSV